LIIASHYPTISNNRDMMSVCDWLKQGEYRRPLRFETTFDLREKGYQEVKPLAKVEPQFESSAFR